MRAFPPWLVGLWTLLVVLGLSWVLVFPHLPVRWLLAHDANGAFLDLIRGHRTTVPFHLAWSSEGWRWVGWLGRLLPSLGVLGALWIAVLQQRRTAQRPGASKLLTRRASFLVGAALTGSSVLLFVWGRIPLPVLLTYGDSVALIPQIAAGTWVFPAEPLMMHVFNVVSRLVTATRGMADGLLAGRITATLCGAWYVLAAWVLTRTRTQRRAESLWWLAAFALTGTATQFFGYVETTLVQTAAILSFLAAIAVTLQAAPGSNQRDLGLWGTHACMGIVLCSHAAGIALLPALAVLWVLLWKHQRQDRDVGRPLLSARNIAGAAVGIVLPWATLVWWPFVRLGRFGNAAGGADAFRFVPWDAETARLASPYIYYDMLSPRHAADLFAAIVAGAPFAVALLVTALVWRKNAAADAARDGLHLVFLVAALGCASVVALWDFDFGMWGDWNIATCYLVPLHVAGWTACLDLLPRNRDDSTLRWSFVVPIIVVQAALAFGMWKQFHPPGVG